MNRRLPFMLHTLTLAWCAGFANNAYPQVPRGRLADFSGYTRLNTASPFGRVGDILGERDDAVVQLGNVGQFAGAGFRASEIDTYIRRSRSGLKYLRTDARGALQYIAPFLPEDTPDPSFVTGNLTLQFPSTASEEVDPRAIDRILWNGVDPALLRAERFYEKMFLVTESISAATVRLNFDVTNASMWGALFTGRTEYRGRGGQRVTVKYPSADAVELTSEWSYVLAIGVTRLSRVNAQKSGGQWYSTLRAVPSGNNFAGQLRVTLTKCKCRSCPADCGCCPRQ